MSRSAALVLAGHGSQQHRDSAAPVHAHADRIRDAGRFDEVRTAFWREEPTLRAVRSTVESDVAYVVPVLTSGGYFADEVFPRELGVGGRTTDDSPSTTAGPAVRYTEPVGTHEAMTDVIEARVERSIEGPRSAVGVALVGHGTERHAASARATLDHAERLRSRDRYAEVSALFLDEEPRVGSLYDRLDADELVVVPFFVADGHHTTRDVPEAIGHPGVGASATIHGRRVHYPGAVGTEPGLAEVIVERAVEAGADATARSTGRPDSPADAAFRRWVDASPEPVLWGELLVSGRSGGYELRHRDDGGAARDRLERIERPRDLRSRVRSDDEGRYRPLAGARSLPTGWVLGGLDGAGLDRAVRFVYPGSVPDWWRDQNGDPDPTPFHETAARQSGAYADLVGTDAETLAAAVEAVCGDCVRRRCWEASPDEAIDAPAGDGDIPCREACPFLLSAAHSFDGAADLDPAVREDSAVQNAAFDEPGNRYRVRYARAAERRAGTSRDEDSRRSLDDAPAATAPTGGDH